MTLVDDYDDVAVALRGYFEQLSCPLGHNISNLSIWLPD